MINPPELQLMTKFEMTGILQAQVCGCISAHTGYPTPMGVCRNFSRGGNVVFLFTLFRLLTMQHTCTFTKRFTFSTPQRKYTMLRQQSRK